MAHDHCNHDDDEPCGNGMDVFDMHADPAAREIVGRENKVLREIFSGFEAISVNALYVIMETVFVQAQISNIDNKRYTDIVENATDSLFTVLVRLTEDFPEPQRKKIREMLIDMDFLEEAYTRWADMIDSLQEEVN